jgi:uncharacterized membrane protein (DUF106 family)
MQTLNTLLDAFFYKVINPLVLFIRDLLDLLFLDTLSFLHIPPSGQVVAVAGATVLFAFFLRWWLKVDEKNKEFQKDFAAQKKMRDDIQIVKNKKSRDAMYQSADQSIDEDFNTYLAQHYFRYVLVYMLPVFLVMAWLNNSLDEHVLPTVSGQAYLLVLPSRPLGMQGFSVTLLFLLSYILFLILGFQFKKKDSTKIMPNEEVQKNQF